MKKIFILLFLTAFNAYADYNTSWVSFANISHGMGSYQKDTSGGTNLVSFGPGIFVGTTFPSFLPDLGGPTYFAPSIGFAKFSSKDNASKSEIILKYHLANNFMSTFQLVYGVSNYITKIKGDGSSLTLNNGTGTATFYSPSTTTTTYTAALDIGGKIKFMNEVSMGIEISIERFLSSRRTLANTITLDYWF